MSRVDVIIPCYRYGHFLRGCVESVLSQEGVDVRVLVLDDASPDHTAEVGEALAREDRRVTFRRHAANRGHIATYNEGLAWATGDYTLLLSADDLLTPGALGRAVAVLEAHPEVVLAYGREIRTADPRPGEFVRLRVCDTGHGIPAEIQRRIFEPYFTTKGPGKGTGLGLAMVFGIVKQHQGWTRCTSTGGQGTCFDVYLPRLPAPAAEPPAPAPPAPPTRGTETVLLVDDDPVLRRLGRTILEKYGYRVLLAADGKEGLDQYRRHGRRPEHVQRLDHGSPDRGGGGLHRRQARQPFGHRPFRVRRPARGSWCAD